jgi:hypothetical protein
MLKRVVHFAGIDKAIFFSLLNKATVIVFAIVTLGLVVTYLSPTRQGYYYTFTSLLTLQTLLELGMGTVLVQFVSHEYSRMRLNESGLLEGDKAALGRTAALFSVALRWYGGASVAFLIVVGAVGSYLLTRHGTPPGVLTPWWLLCAAVSISILQVPLRSFLEGSDQIARVQKVATAIACCASVAGWIALLAGLELYSLAISTLTTAGLGLALFGRACLPFLRLRAQAVDGTAFSWRREFWPQQWRIAVSWASGYFMFQSFVPILFYFAGPVAAGRMGASMQVYTAVNSFASAWIYAKGPRLGMLGAAGRIAELRSIVRGALIRSTLVAAVGAVLVLVGFLAMKHLEFKSDRFVGVSAMLLLLLTVIVMQRSNIETLAVRFQKIEPFMTNSTTSAGLVFGSNVAMSRYFGELGVCFGFAFIMFAITVPWCHRIYTTRMGALAASG